jgi:ADP-ribose pyrophosphatase YjhB (NUDIX family)
MNNTDIHPIQSRILCELLFVTTAGFAELNKEKFGSDLFSFHLRQLTDGKLIEKNSEGKYCLTTKGKEYANRFDTKNKELERQPKIGVLIIGVRENGGVKECLMQKRLKQPYYGFWGFVSGKIKWGEKVREAATRELTEETGLTARLVFVGLKHRMARKMTGELLEDKFFLVFRAENTKGELLERFGGGENRWINKGEIAKLENLFDDVLELIDITEDKKVVFKEDDQTVDECRF